MGQPQPSVNFPAESMYRGLFTDTEALDQLAVLHNILMGEILQQALSLADQHQQRAAAGMVLAVLLQVLRQFLDAIRKQSDLSLRRAGVHFRTPVLFENFLDFFLRQIITHNVL